MKYRTFTDLVGYIYDIAVIFAKYEAPGSKLSEIVGTFPLRVKK